MTTLPHSDNENGYSLRVSRNLPPNSANLAYVKSDTPSTSKNLLLENNIKTIAENKMTAGQKRIHKVFSKNDMKLETEEGLNSFSKSDVEITDEYDIFSSNNDALFYVARTKGLFDARASKVFPYINGSQVGQEQRYEELILENKSNLIYNDNKIFISKENGIPLNSNEKYKIKLSKDGEDDYSYRIYIYSNFDIYKDTYEIHYPKIELNNNKEIKEILNFESIFEKIEYEELKNISEEEKLYKKVYSIVGDNKVGYTFYAPNPTVELSDINEASRPAHDFEYSIEANLKTRISDKNKASINVGLIYINETSFNQRNISSVGKKIFNNNNYMPNYITFNNPHPGFGMNLKEQYEYWLADISMPPEHYLDYDILIISGYGEKNFNKYNAYLEAFLNDGGLLIYDNCGSGTNVLNTTISGVNTFINNIGFSKTENYTNTREYANLESIKNRYYELESAYSIGLISPKITFLGKESEEDWRILLQHKSEGSSVLIKENEYNGNLIISNTGLMLDVLMGNNETLKFLVNTIILFSENKFFKTPLIKDYVYHKDNLFKKEYMNENEIVYIEDKHDLDSTQIVSKKILANSINEKMMQYIPAYFRNSTGNYLPKVSNSGQFEIPNASFERTNSNGVSEWTASTVSAIPHWDTEFISGSGSAHFQQINTASKTGNYSVRLKTTNARASWMASLGMLPAGKYSFQIWFSLLNNSEDFSYGLYNTVGELLFESDKISGNTNWQELNLLFEISKSQELFIKIGAHSKNQNIEVLIDDIALFTENTVRMNLLSNGNENLYAYATSPKGEGINLSYNNLKEDDILKENTILSSEILIKSYVYQWSNEEAIYKKKYGNSSSIPFEIKNSDGIKVLSKLLSWIPPINDGIEWADKTRVYYEIDLKDILSSKYINLEIYDPSIDKYYYTAEGIAAINYNDLWWNSYESTVVVRASTSFYGLKITNRHYNILFKENYQIDIDYPATMDERDRWYPRIKNGSFQKKSISSKELEELSDIGIENYYDDKIIGIHEYSVPEYENQAFFPRYGEREILNEKAEYLNSNKIKVQRNPLSIREENVIKETLISANKERTVFNSNNNWWNEDMLPIIYWDENSDGNDTLINYKYKINYNLGSIEFEEPITKGLVKASYLHDNFKIIKKVFKNERINKELLSTRDGFTFHINKNNIANFPQPIIYKGDTTFDNIIHPKEVKINHEDGTITFFEKIEERISLDYNYYIEEELDYKDINILKGEIILNKKISFKDEIYVSYLYKENYFEYKGYYDTDYNIFMGIDFNPTTGHSYIQRSEMDGKTIFTDEPTEKLLGKEVYIYMLPSKSIYSINTRIETDCIRHVLSEDEWIKTKQSNPEAILLGRIQIRENTIVDNTIVLDARSRGGGLKESINQKKIEEQTGYTSDYWDIGSFEGLPYYKNGVNIIQIPLKVLTKNGGNFTEDNIEKIIYKYMSYGEMPIIEYIEV